MSYDLATRSHVISVNANPTPDDVEETKKALAEFVRADLDEYWPREAQLRKSLGKDFVGMTSDTNTIVSFQDGQFVLH